jgi:hypothetical protein
LINAAFRYFADPTRNGCKATKVHGASCFHESCIVMFDYELDWICHDPVHRECVEATMCEKLKTPDISNHLLWQAKRDTWNTWSPRLTRDCCTSSSEAVRSFSTCVLNSSTTLLLLLYRLWRIQITIPTTVHILPMLNETKSLDSRAVYVVCYF